MRREWKGTLFGIDSIRSEPHNARYVNNINELSLPGGHYKMPEASRRYSRWVSPEVRTWIEEEEEKEEESKETDGGRCV